ncbi:hypothetical protein NM208_g14721 [Fusarium decemcellulare]|uniref:Uncharacterized protein n=1 Tax=Fusarium decemcellulare TaxID=57161 RepID=A0ACC1RHR4_9HYPO|nr:hypothetical protein NM208_g14721 [Fusarium decemcellulare]
MPRAALSVVSTQPLRPSPLKREVALSVIFMLAFERCQMFSKVLERLRTNAATQIATETATTGRASGIFLQGIQAVNPIVVVPGVRPFPERRTGKQNGRQKSDIMTHQPLKYVATLTVTKTAVTGTKEMEVSGPRLADLVMALPLHSRI